MTTILADDKRKVVQQVATISILVLAVVLSLATLWLIQGSEMTHTDSNNVGMFETAPASERLSASAALTAEKPILFVFTPVQECEIHYCLTADTVDQLISQSYGDQVNVVEVPVYSAHIYNDGTPPRLFASWDLIPDTPYSEWMPESELTDFGWGLAQTQVVFVSADRESIHHFDQGMNMHLLDHFLIIRISEAVTGLQTERPGA